MNSGAKAKQRGAENRTKDHDATNPFCAAHPDLAGRRNSVQPGDSESISLGPAQEIHLREHANSRTLLRAKKEK
jgi:hypothetical protein